MRVDGPSRVPANTRGLCAFVLVAACSGQATPHVPSESRPATPVSDRIAPQPNKPTPREPAPRKETDGTPFAATTVEPLGPVALSADGRRVVALSESGRATIQWNADDGVLISDDDGPMLAPGASADGLAGIGEHYVARFSDDVVLAQTEVVVFKPGEPIQWRLPAMEAYPSPDGTTIAVDTAEKTEPPVGIRLYRWPELVLERTLPSIDAAGLAFAPRINRIFEGQHFGRLAAWDTRSGDRTRILGSPDPINAIFTALDVSPDGKSLLVGGGAYLGGGSSATGPSVPLLQLWSLDPLRMVAQWDDVRSATFVAFLDDSTFVHHSVGYGSHALVLHREPATAKWTQQADFEHWGPDHVALDRARWVLYGTHRGSTHVACLDLSERGQCPDGV